MTAEQLEALAGGRNPSFMGMDYEEAITSLARRVIAAEAMHKALALLEHDAIDFLQVCEDFRDNAPDDGMKNMRAIRASLVEGRLKQAQAALAAYREASK